jgi:single-strand DNA-binding protein
VWALDYQFDQTIDGGDPEAAECVDEHTCEALTITVDRRIDADALQAARHRPPAPAGGRSGSAPNVNQHTQEQQHMAADNHTTIVGNLVEDPELRFTNTGIAVANLRVAVTQRIQQDGQWRDGDTSFPRVNVWRGQAEHLADSLAKGDRVMVTGRLRQRSWETPEGDKRSVAELEADEVGASLKWATAEVERTSQRGDGDRSSGRERQAERGGDFNDGPPF